MKKTFAIFSVLIFMGCATANAPHVQKLNSLTPGISKAELASYFGNQPPHSTQFVDGHYLLTYSMYTPDNFGTYPYYFVFDQTDTLVGWEAQKGQSKIVAGGVVISIPFPSRK